MDLYAIVPTSASSADGDPIILRETHTTRLVFKPRIVENPADPDAIINGSFVFQRKGQRDDWEDHNQVPLNTLKASEWVKIDLTSGEILQLLHDLAGLYREHRKHGVPRRRTIFLKIAESTENMSILDMRRFVNLSRKVGINVLAEVLDWMTGVDNPVEVIQHLQLMDVNSLQQINSLIGVAALQGLLDQWEENKSSQDEAFWQQLFEENAFALSHVLPYPLIILKGKAYVGGKSIENTGGNLADFLAANPLTRNAVIIEIKTPSTPLLGGLYRDNAYSISKDVSGTITQILNYRYSLVSEPNLRTGAVPLEVYAPQCVVIAGNVTSQLVNEAQQRSFESFRSTLKDVVVIGYDELFTKLQALLDALQGNSGLQPK